MDKGLAKYQRYNDMREHIRDANKYNFYAAIYMTVVFLLFFIALLVSGNPFDSDYVGTAISVTLSFVASLIFLFVQLLLRFKPEISPKISRIENLGKLLEDLERNEKRLNYFYVGNHTIVSMNNPLMIADFNEVLTVWYKNIRYSGTGTHNHMIVSTYNRTIIVPIAMFGASQDVQRFISEITAYCPKCRVGDSKENLEYLKSKREEYKKERSENK